MQVKDHGDQGIAFIVKLRSEMIRKGPQMTKLAVVQKTPDFLD